MINGAGKVDLSESWLNNLNDVIRQGILMMEFSSTEASWSNIPCVVKRATEAWASVCAFAGNATTFIRKKWEVNTHCISPY